MARAQIIRNSFNKGEISPFVLGRTDLDGYHNACESLQNFIPLVTGGIQKRPGTRFIINAQSQATPSRLVAFEFSTEQAFFLEFGDLTLRFFTPNGVILSGGVPYVVTTPYGPTNGDDLWDLKFAQQADVMYIVHPNHPPMKLSRLTDSHWELTTPVFYAPPMLALDQDVGTPVNVNLTLSAETGNGVVATASSPIFIAGDVGKRIVAQGGAGGSAATGTGIITAVGGATAVDGTTGATLNTTATINVLDPFDGLNLGHGNWFLRGAPSSFAVFGTYPSSVVKATNQLGEGIQLTAMFTSKFPTEGSATTFQDTLREVDIGRFIIIDGSVAQITALTAVGGAPIADGATVQVLAPIINTFSDASGNIRMAPASPGLWSLQDTAFNGTAGPVIAAQGFPRAVAFCQNRLVFAGTAGAPQTIWFSVTDDYENFAIGPNDDQAIVATLNSGRLETILALTTFQGVLITTCERAEYALGGGAIQFGGNNVSAITPSNVTSLLQSQYGATRIQPIVVDEDVLYVKRLGVRAGAMAFNIQQSLYATRDLTILSELIADSGFKEMVYQQLPWFVIWFTTFGGNLVGLTYQKENDVWGWHRHFTGMDLWTKNEDGTYSPPSAFVAPFIGPDQFLSVAVIPLGPDASQDLVAFCCQRTLNGQTVFTIEFLDAFNVLFTDCASDLLAAPPGITQLSGLSYLEQRIVAGVAGDGVDPIGVQPSAVIGAAGTFNLEKGLKYIYAQAGLPIIATALTVRVEAPPTIQGFLKRWARIWIRVYQTVGLLINQTRIAFREPSNPMSQGVPPFTGDKLLEGNPDYDRDGRILIQHDQPLPCTVIAQFGTLSVGEN